MTKVRVTGTILNFKEIGIRIRLIKSIVELGDHEKAHFLEDKLLKDFIFTVANQNPRTQLTDMAWKVLGITALDLKRWCA